MDHLGSFHLLKAVFPRLCIHTNTPSSPPLLPTGPGGTETGSSSRRRSCLSFLRPPSKSQLSAVITLLGQRDKARGREGKKNSNLAVDTDPMGGGGAGRQAGQQAERRRRCISVDQTAGQLEEGLFVRRYSPQRKKKRERRRKCRRQVTSHL